MEHAATSISKNRVSRLAVMIADFCNKLCQYPNSIQRSVKLLARDFAISRAQSMTSRASGLNVRFLSVMTLTRRRTPVKPTSSCFSGK